MVPIGKAVSPKKALKALNRQKNFSSFATGVIPKSAIIAATATGIGATEVELKRGNFYGALAASGIPLAIGAGSIALMWKGNKERALLDSRILGRPAIAKKLFEKEKDPKKRIFAIELGQLPFVNAEVIERNVPNIRGTQLPGLSQFRCFSREEVEKLRSLISESWKKGKAGEAMKAIEKTFKEKGRIIGLAVIEPQLTSLFFRELQEMEITPGFRMFATKTIQDLHVMPVNSTFTLDFVNQKRRTTTRIIFKKTGKKNWNLRKIAFNSK